MANLKLVVDEAIPYLRGMAEHLGTVRYLPGAAITAADVADADALVVRTRTRCHEALLAHSRVRFIATATIGYDHLDTAWLAKAGIAWQNCPGCNAEIKVDLAELAEMDGGLDLYGVQVYCSRCTERRLTE